MNTEIRDITPHFRVETKIEEIFRYKGKKYICREYISLNLASQCKFCCFKKESIIVCHNFYCSGFNRSDGKDIYFEKYIKH